MQEVNCRTSHFNESRRLDNSILPNKQKEPAEDNSTAPPAFVNHAAITWDESRKKWVGDSSRKQQKTQKDPVISWSATYDDLLSTNDPFTKPIPLTEMVDFLVDIWHDEGLFD